MRTTLFLILILQSVVLFAQETYLHCGKLIDTKTGNIKNEITIIISSNKVKEIKKGYITPPGTDTQLIDLKDKTVLPGLIDMHVHLEMEFNPKIYLQMFTLNDVDLAFQSTVYAKKTLLAGFTTVRDLGGTGVNTALRNAIEKGYVDGPRIYSAGKSLATTGGHADPTNGMRNDLVKEPGPEEGVVNGIDDARKAVRRRYKNGADVIKITATGGVLSVAKSGHNPQFTIEEIEAISTTAKDYGMHVAAHAHGDEGMQRAILGGVKTIEHGTLMSEKTMEMMKENNVFLVPTISAGKEITEKAKIKGFYPEMIVPKASSIGPKIQETFAKAYKKGVSIAFGTDAGVFTHGKNAMEFYYMVEAGMPEMKAIQSATITNAMVLNDKNIGEIAAGKYADIIAVNGDPTKDIKTLENVIFVMKDGIVYKN
ncbi:MAG: amidohydrolase family protein [Bacteroidota bacterium]